MRKLLGFGIPQIRTGSKPVLNGGFEPVLITNFLLVIQAENPQILQPKSLCKASQKWGPCCSYVAAVQKGRIHGKLSAAWEGPYEIYDKLQRGTYRLRHLDGTELKNHWNADVLKNSICKALRGRTICVSTFFLFMKGL